MRNSFAHSHFHLEIVFFSCGEVRQFFPRIFRTVQLRERAKQISTRRWKFSEKVQFVFVSHKMKNVMQNNERCTDGAADVSQAMNHFTISRGSVSRCANLYQCSSSGVGVESATWHVWHFQVNAWAQHTQKTLVLCLICSVYVCVFCGMSSLFRWQNSLHKV